MLGDSISRDVPSQCVAYGLKKLADAAHSQIEKAILKIQRTEVAHG